MEKSKLSLVFFGVLISLNFLGGCATQDAHRAYFKAEAKMKEASSKLDAKDPRLAKAYDVFTLGRSQMLDARYDLALISFNESIRLSNLAIEEGAKAEALRREEAGRKALETFPAEEKNEGETVAESDILVPEEESNKTEEPVAKLDDELPSKKEIEEALKKVVPVEKSKSLASPKKVHKPTEIKHEKPVSKPSLKAPKVEPLEAGVVVAPAAPALKEKPKKEEMADPAIVTNEANPSAGASAAASTIRRDQQENRRQIPGVVDFVVNDSSIIQESMTALNQTAKFLLENPSNTLVLVGTHSADEPRSIVDARFESIKAYLIAKGVPEDQIRLDAERKRGESEFQMFVIEH